MEFGNRFTGTGMRQRRTASKPAQSTWSYREFGEKPPRLGQVGITFEETSFEEGQDDKIQFPVEQEFNFEKI